MRGEVRLSTTSSVSLSCIQVKLEGISSTQMMVPERRGKRAREKVIHDTHKFLYKTAIVFPPENIRQVSSNSDFTLGPGTHTYPFELHFPRTTSCTSISGVTNIASINKKTRTVVLNNGNFGVDQLKNTATGYVQSLNNPNLRRQQEQQQQEALNQCSYHIRTPLPPTFAHDGGSANVHYFVKVTCKRSSLLKQNYRKTNPFKFRPLDIERTGDSHARHREVFFRREVVFPNRSYVPDSESLKALPNVPAREGFFLSFFGNKQRDGPASGSGRQGRRKLIPYGVEVRLRAGTSFVPGRPPPLKIYLISENDPSLFSLSQYGKGTESNGLGVLYLQSLSLELESITTTSVLETVYGNEIHEQESIETIPLCKNVYDNLKFDLINATSLVSTSTTSNDYISPSSFELEVPRHFYENCRVPKNVVPAFQTCNITRSYRLVVQLGLSSEPVNNMLQQQENKVMIDIVCSEINVLSGMKLHSTLNPPLPNRKAPPLPDRRSHTLPAKRNSIEKSEHLIQSESLQPYSSRNDVSDAVGSLQDYSSSSINAFDSTAEEAPPSYHEVVRDTSH